MTDYNSVVILSERGGSTVAKRKKARVKSHIRKVGKKRIRVKGHARRK